MMTATRSRPRDHAAVARGQAVEDPVEAAEEAEQQAVDRPDCRNQPITAPTSEDGRRDAPTEPPRWRACSARHRRGRAAGAGRTECGHRDRQQEVDAAARRAGRHPVAAAPRGARRGRGCAA